MRKQWPAELASEQMELWHHVLTEIAPSFAIVSVHVDNGAEELESLVKGLATLEQHTDGVESSDGLRIGDEGALVCLEGLVGGAQELCAAA